LGIEGARNQAYGERLLGLEVNADILSGMIFGCRSKKDMLAMRQAMIDVMYQGDVRKYVESLVLNERLGLNEESARGYAEHGTLKKALDEFSKTYFNAIGADIERHDERNFMTSIR
jgi:hypothetical protein